jgi:hypothetical protein
VPAKQRTHGELIALCNPPDQHYVARSFGRRCLCKRCGPSPTGTRRNHRQSPWYHVPLNQLAHDAKVAPYITDQSTVKFAPFPPQRLSSTVPVANAFSFMAMTITASVLGLLKHACHVPAIGALVGEQSRLACSRRDGHHLVHRAFASRT